MELIKMLFSEIYNTYYQAMSKLLSAAIGHELDLQKAMEIINEEAFKESFMVILDAIKNEEWLLINHNYQTPLVNYPKQPLSKLQLRFLKTISLDPRFTLFQDRLQLPDSIEPLYSSEDFYFFDQISDGDPYQDETYQHNFREIYQAQRDGKQLEVSYQGAKGKCQRLKVIPQKLEYSPKDDKFRLVCHGLKRQLILNISRILECKIVDEINHPIPAPNFKKESVTIEITDIRNALERAMLHFANYEKETRQISDTVYQMKCSYKRSDETEVLIRVLSFGPMLKVIEPQAFQDKVKERLVRQMKLNKHNLD